jgi:hypothetical protein
MEETVISPAPVKTRSKKWIWWVVAVLVLGLALICCLCIIAGVMLFRSGWLQRTLPSELPTFPAVTSVPAAPLLPTEPSATGSPAFPSSPTQPTATPLPTLPASSTESSSSGIYRMLDYSADPNWGLVDLRRGFTPDPYSMSMVAFGDIDTSRTDLACGVTTRAPSFAFNLSGGASEGFLRIYFVPAEEMDTTLIVRTPDQAWLCSNNSSDGSGAYPVIDIESAATGKFAVWVGVPQADDTVYGDLSITQSADNTP